MLRSYFTVAWRNLRRHVFHSALNIMGLAAGLAASMLTGLYLYDELSYDHFVPAYQHVYHVGMHINFGGQEIKTASSCPPLGAYLQQSVPGIEAVTRVNPWPVKNLVMRHGDRVFTEKRAMLADSNFFAFFNFRLLAGDERTALQQPHSVVLTEQAAARYFGTAPALGKILVAGNDHAAYTVTGIAAPPPGNSHLQYDVLLSSASDPSMQPHDWGDVNGMYTYYRKAPGASTAEIEKKLRTAVTLHTAPVLEQAFGVTFQDFEKQGGIYRFYPYALADSHLHHPEFADGPSPPGDIRSVYMIGAVGAFILLIACINFMNLSTAQSARRACEVGLRKTFGSASSKLVVQFIAEALLFMLVALAVALLGAWLLMPGFNTLAGKNLSLSRLLDPVVLGAMAAVFALVTLLAASYPAFYLTAFKPVDVLKGNVRSGMKSKGLRRTLVIAQFTIAIALMICTTVVYRQLHYMQGRNIGMDKQQVLILQNTNRLGTRQRAFLDAVSKQAGITAASYTDTAFPEVNRAGSFRAEGTTRDMLFQMYFADAGHLQALKIEMAQGRFFSDDRPADTTAYVLNEAAVRALGWTDPLNQKLQVDPAQPGRPVMGVVRDFNFESFKSAVRPLVIQFRSRGDFMHVRYQGDVRTVLPAIEALWKEFTAGNTPFAYTFLDENYDQLFRSEQRLGKVFTAMSAMAIGIACLGLLGLASFIAEQRTHEIGIRKVMGASVTAINTMLCKEFMVLVAVAFAIAAAVAWYAMDVWLGAFAYRVALQPAAFVASGALAAAVAWLTVSYHFIKAARSNPCKAIRHE